MPAPRPTLKNFLTATVMKLSGSISLKGWSNCHRFHRNWLGLDVQWWHQWSKQWRLTSSQSRPSSEQVLALYRVYCLQEASDSTESLRPFCVHFCPQLQLRGMIKSHSPSGLLPIAPSCPVLTNKCFIHDGLGISLLQPFTLLWALALSLQACSYLSP